MTTKHPLMSVFNVDACLLCGEPLADHMLSAFCYRCTQKELQRLLPDPCVVVPNKEGMNDEQETNLHG